MGRGWNKDPRVDGVLDYLLIFKWKERIPSSNGYHRPVPPHPRSLFNTNIQYLVLPESSTLPCKVSVYRLSLTLSPPQILFPFLSSWSATESLRHKSFGFISEMPREIWAILLTRIQPLTLINVQLWFAVFPPYPTFYPPARSTRIPLSKHRTFYLPFAWPVSTEFSPSDRPTLSGPLLW